MRILARTAQARAALKSSSACPWCMPRARAPIKDMMFQANQLISQLNTTPRACIFIYTHMDMNTDIQDAH